MRIITDKKEAARRSHEAQSYKVTVEEMKKAFAAHDKWAEGASVEELRAFLEKSTPSIGPEEYYGTPKRNRLKEMREREERDRK
jgi:hypothetical protein